MSDSYLNGFLTGMMCGSLLAVAVWHIEDAIKDWRKSRREEKKG